MGNVPELTYEQLLDALRKGRAERMWRARVKRSMKEGKVPFSTAIAYPVMRRCRVRDAIAAMPGYGKAKSEALMERLHIARSRRIGGLGCRQRAALLEALGEVSE